MQFGAYMHIIYLTEMIVLAAEMLQLQLTHGIEHISGVVGLCNRKFASQVVT
jgi:hypothetical protein